MYAWEDSRVVRGDSGFAVRGPESAQNPKPDTLDP